MNTSSARDSTEPRLAGRLEGGSPLQHHGGDNSGGSEASATAAAPPRPEGTTAAAENPLVVPAAALPSASSKKELCETEPSSKMPDAQKLSEAPYLGFLRRGEHHERWAWLAAVTAEKTQQLLQDLQQQLVQHPSFLAAIPSLIIASVPFMGLLCVLAASLLPLCGFMPLALGVYLLWGWLGDVLQGRGGHSQGVRIAAICAVLLFPMLLLPAAGFFAAGGLLLMLLLPLLCFVLPLGIICFLPVAAVATALLLALSLVAFRGERYNRVVDKAA
ncbi:uncharacterized protein LOC34624014 [Cyclospora cayetanensis]|uniref:Uncharacterized protein LOC34624014 n=1 Tax=Cyclospora cayetanensis TaxID=88456 RepID=A0A6P6RTA7_9EIME|nr:uncharacterized protein LOC34624014 [Cyclospora cayetanensis]